MLNRLCHAGIMTSRPNGRPNGIAAIRRRRTYEAGLTAEDLACRAIEADGWTVLGRRLRTSGGEIDIAADKAGLLAVIEVKRRKTLALAAVAVTPRQRLRLAASCELLLARHPDWGEQGVRFDLILVDPAGGIRRIADAFRPGDPMA